MWQRSRVNSIAIVAALTSGCCLSLSAQAQIIPDGSLGSEGSSITPNVFIQGDLAERIDGGAVRASTLFHSFLDFNVNDGQRVYFANPTGVFNIITRVTGFSESQIHGVLGVDGNANLFVINPNGLVFGPNATLDIRGSFTGSTSAGMDFDSGYVFSALNPNEPPLLSVNLKPGLSSWLPSSGNITHEGLLSARQDLTLIGDNLILQGQLQAGENLTLVADNVLQAQDNPLQTFQAVAGNVLLMQGNQGLEINALSHPESGLFSGGDLVLRSSTPVIGDTHYLAGGNFRVEQLNGSLGSLSSPNDPVIRASGDVSFANYTGASLHILAGGSVTIDSIEITGPDTLGNSIQELVTLSDNQTTVNIDGSAQPTLDIRAGTLAFGTPGVTGDIATSISPEPPLTGAAGSSADITIGSITITEPNGLVFLSNQYFPNLSLSGDIVIGSIEADNIDGGGNVFVNSKGGINTTLINVSGGDVFEFLNSFDFNLFNGNGGDIVLLANGEITLPEFSEVYSYGLQGGSITVRSNTAIRQRPSSFFEGSTIDVGTGGDFSFKAPLISLLGGVAIYLDGDGTGGSIHLEAETFEARDMDFTTATFGGGASGEVIITANNIFLDNAFVGSFNGGFAGQGGDVFVRANVLSLENGSQVGSLTGEGAVGDAGNVTVNARDSISIRGFQPGEVLGFFSPSAIVSGIERDAEGNGGSISITTRMLSVTNGAQVRASSLGTGNAGSIRIDAADTILLDGAVYDAFDNNTFPSSVTSEIIRNGQGRGGDVIINTRNLIATNGGVITVSSNSLDAGNIDIKATGSVIFDGVTAFDILSVPEDFRVRESGLRSEALASAIGSGGSITITTPNFSLTNGATIEAATLGAGNAGNIKLNVIDTVLIDGEGSSIFASTSSGSTGQGGTIYIDPRLISILNGGEISVTSEGSGVAGNILLEGGSLILDRGRILAETVSSAGGNIILRINDVIVLLNNSRISTTAGTALAGGDGGNIDIATTYLVAQPNGNNDITANAFLGAGGSVLITAQGIFGFTPRSRAELERLLGTSDPALLDPARLATNDITAISRGNPNLQGQVIIQSPDVDPNQGAVPLPENVVDASRLIAQGCATGGTVAQEIGSLVATGRGGLPPSPSDSLGSSQVLVDWATGAEGAAAPVAARANSPTQLVEVQSLALGAEGQVALLAQGSSPVLPTLTCAATPGGN
jgi:filamentous hemagglutinin family protein